jgi:polyphosphate kinase 2 (PPK2 family)
MCTKRDSHALLLIFQAMDGAGKDGAIRHVVFCR